MFNETSDYLISTEVLVINPELAQALGVGESAIIQQMRYWLKKSKHRYDGRCWVYNTYEDWQKQLPWMSSATIKRKIQWLEEIGIVISANYNTNSINRTKWYSLDYDEINSLVRGRTDQNDPTMGSKRSDHGINLIPSTITETTTETTTTTKDVVVSLMIEMGVLEKEARILLLEYKHDRCMAVLQHVKNLGDSVQNAPGLIVYLLRTNASLCSKLPPSVTGEERIKETQKRIAEQDSWKRAEKIPEKCKSVLDIFLKKQIG